MPLFTNDNRSATTIAHIAAAVLLAGLTACNLVDDEPPDLGHDSDTDGEAGQAECLAAAEQIQSQCLPPQQFIAMWDEGNSSMILVDDPAASVGIGPGGWLVQVGSSADYIGSYQFDGDTCTIGCGWCQPGRSLCHSGFDENGLPACMMCIPADTPDPGEQCAAPSISRCAWQPTMGGSTRRVVRPTPAPTVAPTRPEPVATRARPRACSSTTARSGNRREPWCSTHAATCSSTPRSWRRSRCTMAALCPTATERAFGSHRPSTGHFAIARMTTTGLLAQMGLRPDDVILAIDGDPMTGIDTIASTTVDLFLGSRVTSGFTLTIGRGREVIAKAVRVR